MSVPPLPKIDGDAHIILDVYTHSSLRGHLVDPNDEYGDADRLALLGKEVLDLAITHYWYRKLPLISAEQLMAKRVESLSEERLVQCINGYNLARKLRYAPNVTVDTEMCRTFLDTYVGALFIRNGLLQVQNFVSKLIDPNATPEDTEVTTDFPLNSKSAPPPPSQPPPPPPPPPDYSAPHNNGVSLAVFNQVATQRGYVIAWTAESTGPPHLPTWTVRCCLNGIEKGRGTGRSQKTAKEDAARQAWAMMGGFSF